MDFERHRSLQQAMTALAGGDREAFDVAYREAHALLFAYARRLLGDGPDAEDATQQALLNLFRNAVRFDGSRDALPWILSIGANTCRTELRRRRRRRREVSTPPDQLEAPGEAVNPEREIIDRDLVAAAEAVVRDLRPGDAETIRALIYERPRPKISAAAFRKRVERARTRLRLAWKEKHETG